MIIAAVADANVDGEEKEREEEMPDVTETKTSKSRRSPDTRIPTVEAQGVLTRWTQLHALHTGRELAALAIGEARPLLFASGEIFVGEGERALIQECFERGGQLVPWDPIPQAPAP